MSYGIGGVNDYPGRQSSSPIREKMAETAARVANKILTSEYPDAPVEISADKEDPAKARHPGFGLLIVAETTTGCFFGGDSLGKRGERSEDVGTRAAKMLLQNLKTGGCVDQHLQDQIIVFMALAKGISKIRTGPLTLHTETAIHIAEMLTDAKFTITIEESGCCLLKCDGTGFSI